MKRRRHAPNLASATMRSSPRLAVDSPRARNCAARFPRMFSLATTSLLAILVPSCRSADGRFWPKADARVPG
jgi:hypothetical protein